MSNKSSGRKRSLVEMEQDESVLSQTEDNLQDIDNQQLKTNKRSSTGSNPQVRSEDIMPEMLMKAEVKKQVQEPAIEDEGYYEILSNNEFADENIDPEKEKTNMQFWCKCPLPPKGESGCLADCENRAKRVECDIALCKAGDQCSNRAIQLSGLEKIAITEGYGGSKLISTTDTSLGTYLAQYTGQLVTKEGLGPRLASLYQPNQRIHVMPLNKVWVLDATVKGSICRLATHSCAPNVYLQSWLVNGLECLAMYSNRDLKANENITLDHCQQMEILGASKRCNCGARSCRRLLGGFAYCDVPTPCSMCQVKCGHEGRLWLHPVLGTPVCHTCKSSWMDTDFSPSLTNGKEATCKWCAKPGGVTMLSCTVCPLSFCKKCLKINLGPNYIKLAETGSWTCLVCDTRPLDKLRGQLRADGEQPRVKEKPMQSNLPNKASSQRMGTPPAVRSALPRFTPPRPVMRGSSPGIRPLRPRTPSLQSSRFSPGPRPRTPFPPRLVGQSNLTVERVPRPMPQPKVATPPQTSAIISQLQRYSGLSIQPVSHSVSQLEAIVKEVKSAQKILYDAVQEAERGMKEENISKMKDKLVEEIRAAKTKLTHAESKM